jgi:hypothetical protein
MAADTIAGYIEGLLNGKEFKQAAGEVELIDRLAA